MTSLELFQRGAKHSERRNGTNLNADGVQARYLHGRGVNDCWGVDEDEDDVIDVIKNTVTSKLFSKIWPKTLESDSPSARTRASWSCSPNLVPKNGFNFARRRAAVE